MPFIDCVKSLCKNHNKLRNNQSGNDQEKIAKSVNFAIEKHRDHSNENDS